MKIAKQFFVSLILGFLLAPALSVVVYAAGEVKPEFNPMCWEEKVCNDKRAELRVGSAAPTEGGWLEKEGECDKQGWGKCLPIGATKTQISFGGKSEFYNIGEFIQNIYNFSLVAIQILAVVVIIIAGAQWASSAGNAETIGKAKKRITGAVIGLIIALMSYVILNTINPATVKLRLPQVYMIREQVLPSKWCRELKPETLFAYATDGQHQSDKIEATGKETGYVSYAASKPTAFWCGQRFFIENATADAFCLGDRCETGQVCSDVDPADEKNPYMCRKANIAGTVTKLTSDVFDASSIIGNLWEDVDDEIEVHLYCFSAENPRGWTVEVDTGSVVSDLKNGKQGYLVGITDEDLDKMIAECGGETHVAGAFMTINLTPNHSFNFMGEKFAIGANGKVIWGGVYYDFIESMPGILRADAFINKLSLRTGVGMPDIDSSEIFMSVQMTHNFGTAFDWFFSDKTMDDIVKEELKRIITPYALYLGPIGQAQWGKLLK